MRLRAVALAAVAPLVISGVGATASNEAAPQKLAQLHACSRAGVKALLRSLVTALNAGDLASVDEIVAKEPAFMWYSVQGAPGRRIGAAARNRGTLLRYLRERRRQKEQLSIRGLVFPGYSEGQRLVNFNFVATRRALDYGPKTIVGKGAVNCRPRPRVAVWSLGG
jgi:hypothetical protein